MPNGRQLSVAALLAAAGCAPAPEPAPAAPVAAPQPRVPVSGPFSPLEPPQGLDPAVVDLGRRLFHDTRMSSDGTVSCASCHDLARGGVDGLPRSVGVGGAVGEVNTPTVLNAGLSFAQFWDGRAGSLEEQIDGPLSNAVEMGTRWPDVVQRLGTVPAYQQDFAKSFPEGLTPDTVKVAIATFERSLVTVDAPFDRYLRGDAAALSDDAQAGLALFRDYGCVACHQGAGLGGNMYQVFGVMGDYFEDRGDITEADLGRYNVTGRDEDRHVFKVPSLRNVALTAPYFHDASAPTLHAAVEVMGRYQLGREIPPADVELLVAFLESLTGKLPEDGS